jgi:hypothetical protein
MAAQLASNSVKTYHLAPEGFAAARNKFLRKSAVFYIGILLFLLVLEYREFGDSWKRGSIVLLFPLLLIISFIFSAMAIGVKKGVKRNQESWLSYELLIGEDFLIRRMKDFRELEIQRHEITAIKEDASGLRVETNLKDRVIGIAPALVDYEDARARLSQWMAPVPESQPAWLTPARWTLVLPLLVLIFFAFFFLATRSWIIVSTGVPLLVVLTWSLSTIRKTIQLSAHTKRLSFIGILPLLAIATRLILAIINWR